MLDVPRRLGVPVLLVVGIRLGCLNHALLSARAIRERGVRSAGWVANRIDPRMARADDNVAELAQRLGAPPVADFPWGGDAAAARRALAALALVAGPQPVGARRRARRVSAARPPRARASTPSRVRRALQAC